MDSTFNDNSADAYGGTLYLGASIQSVLRNNYISSDKRDPKSGANLRDDVHYTDKYATYASVGDMLDSRGITMLVNNTFRLATARDNVSVVSYRAGKLLSFQTLVCGRLSTMI